MGSQIVQSENSIAFIESDCKIELGGREFTSGGAWLCQRIDTGRFEGWLYAYKKVISEKTGSYQIWVGTWDGSKQVHCTTGQEYYSNFGDTRQSLWFRWNGRYFWGIWYKSGGDLVKCREIKAESYWGGKIPDYKPLPKGASTFRQ
jgi:hypothetical protein